jgi:hypothetical protein
VYKVTDFQSLLEARPCITNTNECTDLFCVSALYPLIHTGRPFCIGEDNKFWKLSSVRVDFSTHNPFFYPPDATASSTTLLYSLHRLRIEEYSATNMKHYIILMVLIEFIQFCCCEVKPIKRQKIHSRKKRYLSFPDGSSIVVSVLPCPVFSMRWKKQNGTQIEWEKLYLVAIYLST